MSIYPSPPCESEQDCPKNNPLEPLTSPKSCAFPVDAIVTKSIVLRDVVEGDWS